ncbi:putative 2-carboxy-D-arabinitol-1-phosphatase [Zea mays]|uniref:2-carboxy-D-arabinitol-1-phosphatase n=1 Tax=Zea mays TaxID=4577 RepID=A0A1D6QHM6_MAIZE|nr:putative 2-carboxy-D-arabinitol-1-phosphatase [Zea mays]
MLQLAPTPLPSPAAGRRPRPSSACICCSSVRALEEAKRVVLVRHGQSTWNAEGRIQGSSDASVLTPKGEAQAETCRQMLASDSFDACFTSPLARSRRTAEIIWQGRGRGRGDGLIPDPDLREIDLYSFQGLLKREGRERYGPLYRQWQKNAAEFSIDGHYPVQELWDRARSCWERILAHRGKSVLVVAHNAVNQALVATSLGLGAEHFRILLQSNCGASVLDFTPRAGGGPPTVCLNRLNQVQEAADCLGADCVPRYVETKRLIELEIEDAFQAKQKRFGDIGGGGTEYKSLERVWARSEDAWQALLRELPDDTSERVVVAVGHPAIHLALICRCLGLPMEYLSSFHLDEGSVSVIDFPDGPRGRGVVRCTNYTAHLGRWAIPITRPN